jgi:hypothetical protein
MNQTELKIIAYNASGIVSNTWNVDLYDSVPMPINKSIVDIREPDKRQSDYSKSLTIPGTANNHQIFSAIFNLDHSTINSSTLNFNPDFNPNLKADAILYRKGIAQLIGYIQLVSIKNVDGAIEYECVIIGKFANLFQDLGELNLAQLDLSEFDHVWNKTNVQNSWATSIIKNGTTYLNFNASGQPNGAGYVYPLIDRGNSNTSAENDYNFGTMYPAVYCKQVVDSIFAGAGYRYQSNFFNSQRFKNLIIPYCGGDFRMTEGEVEDRTFLMTNSTGLSFTSTRQYDSEVYKIAFNTNGNDTNPSGVSTVNHEWTCPAGLGGKYRFALEGNIRITNSGNPSEVCRFAFALTRKRGTQINRFYIDYRSSSGPGTVSPLKIESDLVDIQSGDKVYAECYYGALNILGITADARHFTITFQTGFDFYSNPEANYQEGQTIDIVSALPEKTKQTEFLQYLIKMFNLYVEVDKIDYKKLIIEPRDEFYLDEYEDLTDYLDVSQELEIKPMGLLDFRVFEMTYKSDSDEFNKRYEDVYREPFSKINFNINNDFIRDSKFIDLGFSATPSADAKTNDRIIPKIRPQDPSTDSSNLPVYNIRILQYGGLVNTSQGWNLYYNASAIQNYTQYPYAGMLDKIVAPTFSLEVTLAKAYFYGSKPDITTANLYNSYWLKTITEITDKDSKLISGYFHLSPNQLANLSFRKYYKIENQFYRLHQVEYDLNSNEPVQIEFLKIKTAPNFISQTTTTNGGSGTFTTDMPNLPIQDLPTLDKSSNTGFLIDREKSYTDIVYTNDTFVFTDYSQKIWLVDGSSRTYLPDATIQKPKTGYPYIIIHNQDGGNLDIYPIAGQTIGGSSSFRLKTKHTAWFVPYNGVWTVLIDNNTNAG